MWAAAHHHLDWRAGWTAALGMLIAIEVWWIYFDFVSHQMPIKKRWAFFGWFYLHLPMTMSIIVIGAGEVETAMNKRIDI